MNSGCNLQIFPFLSIFKFDPKYTNAVDALGLSVTGVSASTFQRLLGNRGT